MIRLLVLAFIFLANITFAETDEVKRNKKIKEIMTTRGLKYYFPEGRIGKTYEKIKIYEPDIGPLENWLDSATLKRSMRKIEYKTETINGQSAYASEQSYLFFIDNEAVGEQLFYELKGPSVSERWCVEKAKADADWWEILFKDFVEGAIRVVPFKLEASGNQWKSSKFRAEYALSLPTIAFVEINGYFASAKLGLGNNTCNVAYTWWYHDKFPWEF